MPFTAVPEPSVVEIITAWSTLAAAVATAASVVFIAWQIQLTRKSVQATEKTLAIAHDEFERGRALQIESQRARIDAEMPRLSVTILSQSSQAWMTDVREKNSYSLREVSVEVKPGARFDRDLELGARVQVSIWIRVANDGPRRALVHVGAALAEGSDREQDLVIGVGEYADFWATRIQTVGEWLEIHEQWHAGISLDVNIAEVRYIYPGDVGAIERHVVKQGGSVIEPTPGDRQSVRLAAFGGPTGPQPATNAVVQPFTREYFASRLTSTRLD